MLHVYQCLLITSDILSLYAKAYANNIYEVATCQQVNFSYIVLNHSYVFSKELKDMIL